MVLGITEKKAAPRKSGGLSALLLSPRIWIALAPFAMGCGSAAESEAVSASTEAIYGGSVDDSDGSVVALRIGEGATSHLCTGSLVAVNLVLTAHHCVADRTAAPITCDAEGQSTSGAQLGANVAPSSIHVYLGSQPNTSGPAIASGRTIFAPSGAVGTALCNADVAFVVLDKSVPSITPMTMRLGAGARAGEDVFVVGYGKNDRGVAMGTRQRSDAMPVVAHGKGVSKSGTPLGSAELELGKSNCDGDSGGPVIARATGAILGVASRNYDCASASGHVYVEPSGYRDLVSKAFAYAGAAPMEERPGSVPTAAGDPVDLTSGSGRRGCAVEGVGMNPASLDLIWGVLVVFGIVVARRAVAAKRETDAG